MRQTKAFTPLPFVKAEAEVCAAGRRAVQDSMVSLGMPVTNTTAEEMVSFPFTSRPLHSWCQFS